MFLWSNWARLSCWPTVQGLVFVALFYILFCLGFHMLHIATWITPVTLNQPMKTSTLVQSALRSDVISTAVVLHTEQKEMRRQKGLVRDSLNFLPFSNSPDCYQALQEIWLFLFCGFQQSSLKNSSPQFGRGGHIICWSLSCINTSISVLWLQEGHSQRTIASQRISQTVVHVHNCNRVHSKHSNGPKWWICAHTAQFRVFLPNLRGVSTNRNLTQMVKTFRRHLASVPMWKRGCQGKRQTYVGPKQIRLPKTPAHLEMPVPLELVSSFLVTVLSDK